MCGGWTSAGYYPRSIEFDQCVWPGISRSRLLGFMSGPPLPGASGNQKLSGLPQPYMCRGDGQQYSKGDGRDQGGSHRLSILRRQCSLSHRRSPGTPQSPHPSPGVQPARFECHQPLAESTVHARSTHLSCLPVTVCHIRHHLLFSGIGERRFRFPCQHPADCRLTLTGKVST